MFFDVDTFFLLPSLWHVGVILLIILSIEAIMRRHEYWAFPALMVYGTTWIWYYPDMNVRMDSYTLRFTETEIDLGFAQLILYIGCFRTFLPYLTRWCVGEEEYFSKVPSNFNLDTLFLIVFFLWLVILSIGIITHGQGVLEALFPLAGRRTWSFMFGRQRVGGSLDWLISIAGNTYTILVVFLGLFIFIRKSSQLQHLNVFCYLLSLPFFMLTGTRTALLQVVFPVLLGFFLLARVPMQIKIAWSIIFFVGLNSILIIMIIFRNTGFETVFSGSGDDPAGETVMHDGANMFEELLFINRYQVTGEYPNQWFGNYFSELAQFVPRAFWPGKPEIGAELSILRGFTDGRGNQLGTVAMGKVGQGVVNIGPLLGPPLTALLVALYCGWLCRLWVQEQSPLRTFLFIGGLCFIFNLGRNVGILNLWPIIFGYCLVLAVEKLSAKQGPSTAVVLQS